MTYRPVSRDRNQAFKMVYEQEYTLAAKVQILQNKKHTVSVRK